MSYCYNFERSLFEYDEFETVRKTHHPFIYDISVDELVKVQSQLRDKRKKERTLARQRIREVRGKAKPRGGGFPGTAEQPQKRKQVLSSALKRVNKELNRRRKIEARAANIDSAQRALAMRRESKFRHHPDSENSSSAGMRSLPNRRRRWIVPPEKIGSISQMSMVAQAARDARQ